jgi:hypothetical protein
MTPVSSRHAPLIKCQHSSLFIPVCYSNFYHYLKSFLFSGNKRIQNTPAYTISCVMAIAPTPIRRCMMTIQTWKESSQGSESIRRIPDKEGGITPPQSAGCQFCEKQLVGAASHCPVCGKAMPGGRLSRFWRTCQKTCSFLAYPFLQVHYALSNFFHRTAKRIARPGFERRVEFLLGFTFGLGIVVFLILLGAFALYGNHASYFLFPQEPVEPLLSDIDLPTAP